MATYGLEASHEALLGLGESEDEGASPVWRAAYPHGESELEAETEAFFENLAEYAVGGGGGGGGGRGGGLAGVGRAAAQAALSRAGTAGVPLGQLAISLNPPPYIDGEGELEAQLGLRPGPAGLSSAMLMEHYGHAATLAESEAEAEAFLLPLLPLAAKFVLPKVASFAAKKALPFVMKKVMPRLTRSTLQVGRELRRNPTTRPLVRAMPSIAQRTVADIARQVERGRPVTPELATRYLARETQRVLGNPDRAVRAYRRSRALDRRYHHICNHYGM
jgi:hypothetical protein